LKEEEGITTSEAELKALPNPAEYYRGVPQGTGDIPVRGAAAARAAVQWNPRSSGIPGAHDWDLFCDEVAGGGCGILTGSRGPA
jgi:hypothetical protein